MKKLLKISMLLMIVAWSALAGTLNAQETLTVADGTQTKQYVPLYGFYTDVTSGTSSQAVYGSDLLSDLAPGSHISGLTYYSTFSLDASGNVFEVHLKEVGSESISAYDNLDGAVLVYSGGLTISESHEMVINFTNTYDYQGGNLLISIRQVTPGSNCSASSAAWYGVNSNGSSVYMYGSTSQTQGNFLPKLTITYEPGGVVTCPKPTDLAVSNVTATSAELAWTAGGSETAWELLLNGVSSVVTNPCTLTLNPATTYTAKVRAICGEGDTSRWSNTVNFTAGCAALSIPYFQNFDALATGSATNPSFPPCWSAINNSLSSSVRPNVYVNSASAYVHSSPNSLYFQSSSTTPVYVVLPEIAEQNVLLTFMYRNEGVAAANGTLSVGYLTDEADASTFVELAVMPRTTTFTSVETYFNNIAGSYRIAFKYTGGTYDNYYLAIDDVAVTALPSCLKPTDLAVSSITTTGATLAWTATGNETAWEIELNGATVAANSNPFTVTALAPATIYTAKVRAICGEEDASDWSDSITFITDCEAVTSFPYTQDFEAEVFPPICWSQERTAEGTGTSGTDYPDGAWARYTSSYGNGGNTTAQAQLRDSRVGSKHNLVTGAFDFTYEGGYIVSLDVYRSATGTNYPTEGIRVLVSSTPTIDETADTLAFISRNYTVASDVNSEIVGAEAATGWYTYELPINRTGVNYIIFEGNSQYGSSTYMDNVVVKEVPTCLKPTELSVSDITATSATIAWTANSEENAWEIEVNGETVAADANPFTLENLNPATNYTIRVRALCSDEDMSMWSDAISFSTTQVPATIPYTCNFEDAAITEGWAFANQTNGWFVGTAATEEGNSLYISNDNGATYAYTISSASSSSYAYRTFALSAASSYILSFDWKANGETYYDYLRAFVVPATVALVAGETNSIGTSTTPAGWIAVDGGSKLNVSTEWQTVTGTLLVPEDGNYNLVFYWKNDGSGGTNPPAAIDNISITEIECQAPRNIVASDATTTSAVISWTDYNAGSSTWEMEVNGNIQTISENPYTMENLESGSYYTVRIRTICGEDSQSEWSDAYTFTTVCELLPVPYSQNFDGLAEGSATSPNLPVCWDAIGNVISGSAYPQVYVYQSSSYASSAPNCLYFKSSNATPEYVLLPAFAEQNLMLTFMYRNEGTGAYNGILSVGYLTDETDTSTFVELAVMPQITTLTAAEVIFNRIEENYRIAFKYTGGTANNYYLGIDDVVVTEIPDCARPSNLTVSNIAENSAELSWTSNGDETAWEVEINGATQQVSENPVSLENLSASTFYTVRVRAICSEDENSEWSDPLTFSTACDVVVVTDANAFTESFENDFGCWSVVSSYEDKTWLIIPEADDYWYELGAVDGTQYAIFEGDENGHGTIYSYLISPVMDITAVTDPILAFAHAQEVWSGDQNTLTVYYRTNATEEWTVLIPEDSRSLASWTFDTVALPNPSATYQIAFKGNGEYGRAIILDNVYVGPEAGVTSEPCEVPANVNVVADSTSAVISWESDAASWNIRVNGGEATNVTTNPYTLTGLTPETEYTIEIQAVCDEDNTSDWTGGTSFTTQPVGIAQYEGITTTVFPNPATAELNVRLSANINGEIAIYDVYGKMLRKEAINGQNATINVANIADGVYFLRVSDSKAVVSNIKFVKK